MAENEQVLSVQKSIQNAPRKKMYLTSHQKARKHLARLINEFDQDPGADVRRYRCIGFLFNILLEYFKHADNLLIEERLNLIEERLEIKAYAEAKK